MRRECQCSVIAIVFLPGSYPRPSVSAYHWISQERSFNIQTLHISYKIKRDKWPASDLCLRLSQGIELKKNS